MQYFKITKTWSVKAEDEAEAYKMVAAEPNKYLDSETVQRTEYKRQKSQTGIGQVIRDQVLGNSHH